MSDGLTGLGFNNYNLTKTIIIVVDNTFPSVNGCHGIAGCITYSF